MNTVHDTTTAAKDKAQEVGSQVGDQAKSQVDTRTTQAGDQLQDKADGLHQMSDQLRDSGQDAFAQLTDKVAALTEDVARYMRDADADKIMGDVESLARRQPWAVAAGGLFLGLAASRIVKAATDNRGSAQNTSGRYSTGATPDSIDLTRGYAAGTGYSTGAPASTGYSAGTSTGVLPTGYEPLGSDIPSENPVPSSDPAPLGDPEPFPTPSTQPGPSSTGSYTDGNR